MADNYIEKRMEEIAQGGKTRRKPASHPSLDSLLLKNRSCRGYDTNCKVTREQLMQIVSVANKVPSACNQQVLRFRLVTAEEAGKVNPNIRMGAALPDVNLPLPGTEPQSFIVICSTIGHTHWADVDLGIMAQSMLLKTTEMKLSGLCIAAINRSGLQADLSLPDGLEPMLVLAIGKGIEHIQLTCISEADNHRYYRKDGIHYVPKLKIEDMLI